MKQLPVLIFLILLTSEIFSQGITVKGVVRDSSDNSRLISAVVALKDTHGKLKTHFATTDGNGAFRLENISSGAWVCEITYMGYKDHKDTLRLLNQDVNLGNIYLKQATLSLHTQIEVIGHVIPAEQKADTVEYTAKAFKTEADANAEALVTKIPGVQNDNGTLKAQGEQVQQVLVDGKPFFGEDPTVTLRNLPAEIIDKVQVFDKMSDQAQFTGFDDGNSTKAINIITKSDKRNGQFGKIYGGYGTDDRFQGGGAINLFTPGRKFSIIGLGNNINQQNFSQQDILGLTSSSNSGGRFGNMGGMGGGRSGGGGQGGGRGLNTASNFLVGTQDGNTNTYSSGMNFTDNSVKDLTVNLSYFFNNAKNTTDQNLTRQYFSTQTYDENSEYTSNNLNHRINGRVEYAFDTLNSLIYTPKVYFQNNKSTTDLFGENYLSGNVPLSSAKNNNATNVNGYQISNDLLLRHKFSTSGRTLSFGISAGLNFKRSNADVLSISDYIKSSYTDTLDEKTIGVINGRNLSGNLVYTEPLGLKSQLQLNASASIKRNVSDKKADSLDFTGAYYNVLDTLHSNVYANNFKTLSGGVSYRWSDNPFNLTVGAAYQKSMLFGDQTFPFINQVDKTFENVLPNLRFIYRPSRSNFIRLMYNTSVNAPSIDQLQNTIDNSNTLLLKGGNPNLKAEYNHRLVTQYISTNTSSGTSFFTMFSYSYTENSISNATITATKDSTLSNGMILNNGSQFTSPVNLDHSLQLRSFTNAGFMLEPILSTMNFNASVTYTTTPGLINNVENISKTAALGGGVMLTSNISEDVDYRISYNPTYNETHNDVQKSLNNNYIIHNANASFYWMYYGNLFLRTDVTYYYNSGLTGGVQKDYYLWNAAIGSKLFADKTGEIKLEVFDILKQNKSLSKTVADSYIEDRNTQVLKQYVLLTFTYNLKRF
jgi:hypothetical protein